MNDSHPFIQRLAGLLAQARHAVIFTGAGMSTESGIPDFRSPGGIWTRMRPIDFRDFVSSAEARREYWSRVFSGDESLSGSEPNAGHQVIADWVRAGRVAHVITQNVDGLHQQAGTPEEHVTELHGNAGHASCLDCGQRVGFEELRPAFEASGQVPPCTACGGLVKRATISFGQAMPPVETARAEAEARAADLFISIGSSLQVYPAAGLPLIAARAGASTAIINREATGLDGETDLVIHAEIGSTLQLLQRRLG